MGSQDELVVAVTRAEVAESDARQLAQEVRHLQAEMTAARWALNAADIMRNSMSETITKERAEVARLTAALAESDASTEAAALMLERDALSREVGQITGERDKLMARLAQAEAVIEAADVLRNEIHARKVACCLACAAALAFDRVRGAKGGAR
jgi:chromosome segregation ATPase